MGSSSVQLIVFVIITIWECHSGGGQWTLDKNPDIAGFGWF